MARWPQIRGRSSSEMVQLGGGVNKGVPPFDIENNQWVDMKNLAPHEFPSLAPRKPFKFESILSNAHSLVLFNKQNLILLGSSNKLFDINGNEIDNSLSGNNLSFVNFIGELIIAHGGTMKRWDGSGSLDNISEAPEGKYLTVHAERLYTTGIDSEPNKLAFSALRKIDDWTTVEDSGAIWIESRSGEPNSAVVPFEQHIIIFKPNSMFELYGTGPHNFEMINVSESIGCVSHRSLQEVRGELFFLGPRGVYTYQGGVQPKRISQPVEPIIEDINTDNIENICSGTDGRGYLLAIPTGDNDYADTILYYDTLTRTWWIWDGLDIKDIILFENQLKAVNSLGDLLTYGQGDEEVEWYCVSKPISDDTLTHKKHWFKMSLIFKIEYLSLVEVYVSTESEGEDWFLLDSVQGKWYNPGVGQKHNSIIPPELLRQAEWVRVKLTGKGNCVFYGLGKEIRVTPQRR